MHPILFQFRSVTVYTYGFFMVLAVAAVFWIAARRAASFRLPPSLVTDLIFLLFISGVLGARAFYVFQHGADFSGRWARAFAIQEGGLVWYGGFITAALAGLFYAAVRGWPVLSLCDFFAPLLALAHAIGRIGCFMNGCCFGRTSDSRFGVIFPGDSHPRLPVQLYEASFLFALSLILFSISPRKYRPGTVFLFYLISYSAFRFFIEFLRGDQIPVFFLTPPQWTSLLLLGFAVFLYFFSAKDAS